MNQYTRVIVDARDATKDLLVSSELALEMFRRSILCMDATNGALTLRSGTVFPYAEAMAIAKSDGCSYSIRRVRM